MKSFFEGLLCVTGVVAASFVCFCVVLATDRRPGSPAEKILEQLCPLEHPLAPQNRKLFIAK
jgi:hypothetical protein